MRRRCVDPLNKPRITGQPPKRLTFAQADRAISALAAHFIEAGLPANSVDRGSTAEHRRVRADGACRASRRAGGRAASAALAAGGTDGGAQSHRRASDRDHEPGSTASVHADLAMNAAAEAFSIRHVCGFGDDLPEGMASLDLALTGRIDHHARRRCRTAARRR